MQASLRLPAGELRGVVLMVSVSERERERESCAKVSGRGRESAGARDGIKDLAPTRWMASLSTAATWSPLYGLGWAVGAGERDTRASWAADAWARSKF